MSTRIPANECPYDMAVLPYVATNQTRPRTLSFGCLSKLGSKPVDFSASQHHHMSSESSEKLSRRQVLYTSGCCRQSDVPTSNLCFLELPNNCCFLCYKCMSRVELARSISLTDTSKSGNSPVTITKKFYRARLKLKVSFLSWHYSR